MDNTNSRRHSLYIQILNQFSSQQKNPVLTQRKSISAFPLVSVHIAKFAYGKVENPEKHYMGKDCVKVFCDFIENEAKRLYRMFSEKSMEPLTPEEWRKFNRVKKCPYASKNFKNMTPKLEIIVIILDNIEDLLIEAVM